MHLLRLFSRLDTELPLEGRATGVVDAQRPGALAGQGMQVHEPPVGRLVQRVVSQQLLGVADRRRSRSASSSTVSRSRTSRWIWRNRSRAGNSHSSKQPGSRSPP
jgi:hypothetical protein